MKEMIKGRQKKEIQETKGRVSRRKEREERGKRWEKVA